MKKRILPLKITILILFAHGLILSGCRKTEDPVPAPRAPVTLVQADITLGNLLAANANIQAGDDSLLMYFYQQDTVFLFHANAFYSPFSYPQIAEKTKLSSVNIPEFTFQFRFKLHDLLPLMDQQTADTLLQYDSTFHVFPEIELSEESILDNGPSEDYLAIAIKKGQIEIKVQNTLPVALENLHFSVLDIQYKTILKEITLPLLDSGAAFTSTVSLLGKKFSNHFGTALYGFSSPGSDTSEVFIDLEKGLQTTLTLKSVEAIGGSSKVNAQLITTLEKWVDLTTVSDEKLLKAMYDSGFITLSVSGMEHSNLSVFYTLPSVIRNNSAVIDYVDAPKRENSIKNTPRQGMNFDFTTHSLKHYNRFPVKFDVYLQASDSLIDIDTSDIAEIQLTFSSHPPHYTEGFYGKKTIHAVAPPFEVNAAITGQETGSVQFAEPSLIFNYYNNLNLPIKILPTLEAINSATSEAAELITDSVKVLYPLIAGESITTEIVFTQENSNVKELFDIHPDHFNVEVGGRTNWNGQAENFSWDTCSFYGDITLKIPLVLQTNSLLFSDTVQVNSNFQTTDTLAGNLVLDVSNGFPFSMTLKLQLLHENGEPLVEIIDFGNIPSAEVDENGKVSKAHETEVGLVANNDLIQKIKLSKSAVILLESEKIGNENKPVSLYSNYKTTVSVSLKKN